jgi:hypothetical protein
MVVGAVKLVERNAARARAREQTHRHRD